MWGLVALTALCFVVHVDYAIAYPKSLYGGSNLHLSILHTNDIHSHIRESDKWGVECDDRRRDRTGCYGGVARIAQKVREFKKRNRNTLFLNAGGFYQGTLWYSALRHKIASYAMTRMGYDAIGLGNNEFDDGPQELAPFVQDMRKSGVPVLGTNIDTSREPHFRGMVLPKSVVLTMSGVKVALLSVVTRETANIARPGGIRILPEVDSINRETWRLKQQGVKIFVLISHVGFDFDQRLATLCPDLDVIVGGHSQTLLYKGTPPTQEDGRVVEGPYPFVVMRRGRPNCIIVQAYRYGKYLGHVELLFDRKGDVTHWRGRPILLDQSVGQDQHILRGLAPFKKVVDDALKKIVGSTKVLLEASNKVCRFRECNMANLMADSFLDYYANRKSTLPHAWSDVNAAVINGGMLRESISQNSNVTLQDLLRAMPVNNQLVLMKMKGSQLFKMFEHAVSNFTWWPDLNGKFLQMAGMRVTYDLRRRSGWRVVWLKILCANCSVPRYEDVLHSKTYTIVTTSFIANGGDGFKFDKGVLKRNEGVSAFYVFTKYFTKLSPIKTAEEGRIVVKNLPPRGKPTSPRPSPTPGFVPGRPQIRGTVPSQTPVPRPPPSQPQNPGFGTGQQPMPRPLPGQPQVPGFGTGQQPVPRPPPVQPQIPGFGGAGQQPVPRPPPVQPQIPGFGGTGQQPLSRPAPGQPQIPAFGTSQSPIRGPTQSQPQIPGYGQGPPPSPGFNQGQAQNSGYGQSPPSIPRVSPGQSPSAGFGQTPSSPMFTPSQTTISGLGQSQATSPGLGQGQTQSPGYPQSQPPSSGLSTQSPGYPQSQPPSSGLSTQSPGYPQSQPPSSGLSLNQAPIPGLGQSQTPFQTDTIPQGGGWSAA